MSVQKKKKDQPKKTSSSAKHIQVVKKARTVDPNARLRKKPKYKAFRLHKRVKHPDAPLPGWFKLTKRALKLMWANKRPLFWFFLVYTVLYFAFVRGLSAPVDINGVRDTFSEVAEQDYSALAINFTVFSLMLDSTTSAAGEVGGMYQIFFLVISILALVWVFRQQQAGNKVTIRQAFYRGMYPLIPFALIMMLMSIQLIPVMIGNFLFTTVIESGLAINMIEQFIWLFLFLLLILLSLYWLSSSLVALFVVTLPEMTPMRALRKAKSLVMFRRFSIVRKIAALAIVVIAAFLIVVFPAIFVSAPLAQFLFFGLATMLVPFAVAYLFVLYRELL